MGNDAMQEYEQEQRAAICYRTFRKARGEKRSPEFEQLRQYFIGVYGAVDGIQYYNDWLKEREFDDNMPLMFQKKKVVILGRQMPKDRHELYNGVVSQLGLEIVDAKNHIVAGYASTPIKDCDGDFTRIEAIREAARKYREGGDVTYAFHRLEPAGIILDEWTSPNGKVYKTEVDKAGWYVVSRPMDNYWKLFQDNILNGYSVGWEAGWHHDADGWVDKVTFDDLSYVPYSCNPLCFLGRAKSQSLCDIKGETRIKKKPTTNILSKEELKMSEELEGERAKLLKEFPDAEEKIKAVDCIDKLKELRVELEAEKNKPKTIEEEFQAMLARRDAAKEKNFLKRLQKETEAEEERTKTLDEEDRFTKVNTELGIVKAKLDEVTQKLQKFETFEARLVKMEDETVIKGKQGGTQETPVSIVEVAMNTDLKTDPMALQKLGKLIKQKGDDA